MKIAIGSDHAGYPLKEEIAEFLRRKGYDFEDFGAFSEEPVDYPDIAAEVAEQVASGKAERGILVCGTGVGMCIAANKVSGIRAAHATDEYTARLSREHNDANVLTLGSRVMGPAVALEIVRVFLETPFSGDPRHARRIQKIDSICGGKSGAD